MKEDYLLAFKRYFIYVAQKCLKLPIVTENRELEELIVKSLDTIFQNALNLRLSLPEEVKINEFGRDRVEDTYNLKHIIQKAIELISRKTIA